jgi:hypothetical protein
MRWGGLADAAGCDGGVVGQVVPGGVIGRTSLGLAGVGGRLALFQSIGWVPGDNLAYGCRWIRENSVWSLAHASGCDVGRWIRQNSDVLRWWDPNSGESGYG